MSNNTKTLRQAAVELLQELGPQHYQKLTDEILSRGIATSSSKTACASDPSKCWSVDPDAFADLEADA